MIRQAFREESISQRDRQQCSQRKSPNLTEAEKKARHFKSKVKRVKSMLIGIGIGAGISSADITVILPCPVVFLEFDLPVRIQQSCRNGLVSKASPFSTECTEWKGKRGSLETEGNIRNSSTLQFPARHIPHVQIIIL
jgi:hypothetical protein